MTQCVDLLGMYFFFSSRDTGIHHGKWCSGNQTCLERGSPAKWSFSVWMTMCILNRSLTDPFASRRQRCNSNTSCSPNENFGADHVASWLPDGASPWDIKGTCWELDSTCGLLRTHSYIYIYMYSIHIYIYMYIHTYVQYTYIYMYMYIYIHTYVQYIYISICRVYIYIHSTYIYIYLCTL